MGPIRAPAILALAVGVTLAGALFARQLGVAPEAEPGSVALHPLLGLAVLRGAAQGDPSARAETVERLVVRSPWLLVGGWVLGLLVAGEGRSAFMTVAAEATFVFVVAGSLALGTSRLAALPPETRDQLRGNGAWLAMIGLVVGLAVLIALPAAALLGGPIGTLAAGLVAVGTTVVLGLAGAVMALVVLVVDLVATLLRGFIDRSQVSTITTPPPEPPPDAPLIPGGTEAGDPIVQTIIAIAIIAGMVLLGWYLARRWQGASRRTLAPRGVEEHRRFELSLRPTVGPPRLPRRIRSWFAPDAAGAYPRLLRDWSRDPDRRRDPAETPAAHAARLRRTGHGDPALDLLAADHQLMRFGGRRLTDAEQRRAVARWRRLRRLARRSEDPDRPEPGRS
jgi:hypothetical protein